MKLLGIATAIALLVCALGFAFYIHRLYQKRNKRVRSLLIKITISLLLNMIPNITPIYDLLYGTKPRWLSVVEISAYPFSIMIGYFTACELLYTRTYSIKDIIKDRVFSIFICLFVVPISITCLSTVNASYTNSLLFEKRLLYYIAYFFYYFCQIYVLTQAIFVYYKEIKQERKMDYKARIIVCMLGFTSVWVFYLLAEINLFLSFFIQDNYRLLINWIVQDFGKGLSFIILLIGFVFPQAFYVKITMPLIRYTHKKEQVNLQLIDYYCSLLTIIVPRNVLKYKYIHRDHIFMLIYDADKMIWSHTPSRPTSPKKQARYIAILLQNNVTVTKMGPHIHPLGERDFLHHHLAIARYLHRIEGIDAENYSTHERPATPR